MIQDIAPHRLRNEYIPEKSASADSRCFLFRGREMLFRIRDDKVELPLRAEFPAEAECTYLFAIDDTEYYLITAPEDSTTDVKIEFPEDFKLPEDCMFKTVHELRNEGKMDRLLTYAAFTAQQLAGWYRDNVFCGTCGGRTVHGDVERSIICPKCGRIIYPRIAPAVIVGVTNGDRILLTKYRGRLYAYYALIAGFTEIGETFEGTVEREVMEEVGIRVKNIRYYKSQPWGVADNILAGYFCDLDGDPTIHLDTNELRIGEWTAREDIILQPDDLSLTNEMMKIFKEGREPR